MWRSSSRWNITISSMRFRNSGAVVLERDDLGLTDPPTPVRMKGSLAAGLRHSVRWGLASGAALIVVDPIPFGSDSTTGRFGVGLGVVIGHHSDGD